MKIIRGAATPMQRIFNPIYNYLIIHSQKWLGSKSLAKSEFLNEFDAVEDATSFQVVWLWNLRRLLGALNSKVADFDSHKFLDLGCGSGISTLYASLHSSFAEYEGVDIEQSLVDLANKNLCRTKITGGSIYFNVADVGQLQLVPRMYVFFIFNSFGVRTLEKFLDLNLGANIAPGSYFLLANDHILLSSFLKLSKFKCIWRDSVRNCSIVILQ